MALYIIAGIIGVFVFLTILGFIISAFEKKNAEQNLQKAQTAYVCQDYQQALVFINQAFYVPLNEKYGKEDAAVAYRVIELMDQVLGKMEADGMLSTKDLKQALQTACMFGGKVPDTLTKPVKTFLERAAEGKLAPATIAAQFDFEDMRVRKVDGKDVRGPFSEDMKI